MSGLKMSLYKFPVKKSYRLYCGGHMKSLSGNGNGNSNSNGNEATTQLACLLTCSESYLVLNIYTLAMFGDNSVNFKPCLVQSSDGHSLLYFTLLYFALLCSAWYSVAYVGKGANYK